MFYIVLTNSSSMFQCCLLLSILPEEIVGEKLEPERLYDSVNLMLSFQVCIISNLC